MDHIPNLSDVHTVEDLHISTLKPVLPGFFVPRLADIPQNPILDTLKAKRVAVASSRTKDTANPTILVQQGENPSLSSDLLWETALKPGRKRQITSWDTLNSNKNAPTSTCFLSEQDSLVVAAATYHVMPELVQPGLEFIHVSQGVLMRNLKVTSLGTSSSLHFWDPHKETFLPAGAEHGRQVVLLVDGKDKIITQSVMSTFLTIGSLIRRLESLITYLRNSVSDRNPTSNAFSHALSTLISHLRSRIAKSPPRNGLETITLTAMITHYSEFAIILDAVASLCNRDETVHPHQYVSLPTSAVEILSRIYQHLHAHIERQSPKPVKASLAFLLTVSSREYLDRISHSVAFGGDGFEENGLETSKVTVDDSIEDVFPDFFPAPLAGILPAAQRSLRLLRAANPEHAILHVHQPPLRWLWRREDVDLVFEKTQPAPTRSPTKTLYKASTFISQEDKVLTQFRLFDMEPGAQMEESLFDAEFTALSMTQLEAFLSNFPTELPPISPTLPILASILFEPLLIHASQLSTALLSLVLSAPDLRNFRSQLVLLRSYLLITSPAFKAKLSVALFSDADQDDHSSNQWVLHNLRRRPKRQKENNSRPWAVGLSPALLERESWPPLGGDLAFLLRTVVVDSLEQSMPTPDDHSGRNLVEEMESKLGFAIRDLPTTSGKEKWLDPLSVEALDFLYMEYKPTPPLDILITPDVLARYQRMFTFLMRVLRVEHAIRALFRLTRSGSLLLFETMVESRRKLLHFRFIAHTFVSNLSGYVFDTAIRGNFDVFLDGLDPTTTAYTNLFSLAKAHSAIMDNILTACLLRSNQKEIGSLLRDSLDLILDFAVHVGGFSQGNLEEYQVAPVLEDIYQRFRQKSASLIRQLRSMDKTAHIAATASVTSDHGEKQPAGGVEAIPHLLHRLENGDWWSSWG